MPVIRPAFSSASVVFFAMAFLGLGATAHAADGDNTFRCTINNSGDYATNACGGGISYGDNTTAGNGHQVGLGAVTSANNFTVVNDTPNLMVPSGASAFPIAPGGSDSFYVAPESGIVFKQYTFQNTSGQTVGSVQLQLENSGRAKYLCMAQGSVKCGSPNGLSPITVLG